MTTAALLDLDAVVPHLVARGVLPAGVDAEVEALGGGVSSDLWAVRTRDRAVVVKQALPKLRVAREWRAVRERALTEARALRLAATVIPDRVPAVLDADPERCAVVIELAPAGWREWRGTLLGGTVDPGVAALVGDAMGRVHAATAGAEACEPAFADTTHFEALRIDPFHRTIAAAHPAVEEAVLAIVDRMAARRVCLVHGDCSPKNVMAGEEGGWLLDWEVAHHGDPTFDAAYMLCHLALKAVHVPDRAVELRGCAREFLNALRSAAGPAAAVDAPVWLAAQTAALLLARVDGLSPAAYLTEEERVRVRAAALDVLARRPTALDAAWERFTG